MLNFKFIGIFSYVAYCFFSNWLLLTDISMLKLVFIITVSIFSYTYIIYLVLSALVQFIYIMVILQLPLPSVIVKIILNI